MKVLVIATKRKDELIKPLIRSGCEVSLISPQTEKPLSIRYTLFIKSLLKELQTDEYDIIVTRGAGFAGLSATLIGRVYQVPVVPRIAGDKFTEFRGKIYYNLTKFQILTLLHNSFRFIMFVLTMVTAKSVIVVSTHLKERYEIFSKAFSQKIHVVPVSINHNCSAKLAPNSNHCQVMLTVTNFNFKGKYEGAKKSASVAFDILSERDNVEYVIAGDGQYLEEFRTYIDENSPDPGVRSRINIMGYVEPVCRLYIDSDIFVYFSSQDGYPNVVLEAMSHGLPIITNDAVGMSNQITHHESGIFVNPDEKSDAQKHIKLLLDDQKKRRVLALNAQKQIRRDNSHEAIGRQYMEKLGTVLS